MSNRILSYKGLLADGAQETILLSTKKGEVGYRITKFQAIPWEPGVKSQESVIKIYSTEQTTVDRVVDFSDTALLGCIYVKQSDVAANTDVGVSIFFDNITFNQDIYITHTDASSGEGCNYYLELEVIKLDESQAMVATLKDIRNNS
jgi:hypothetical protein